jgi:hypothetical protein
MDEIINHEHCWCEVSFLQSIILKSVNESQESKNASCSEWKRRKSHEPTSSSPSLFWVSTFLFCRFTEHVEPIVSILKLAPYMRRRYSILSEAVVSRIVMERMKICWMMFLLLGPWICSLAGFTTFLRIILPAGTDRVSTKTFYGKNMLIPFLILSLIRVMCSVNGCSQRIHSSI